MHNPENNPDSVGANLTSPTPGQREGPPDFQGKCSVRVFRVFRRSVQLHGSENEFQKVDRNNFHKKVHNPPRSLQRSNQSIQSIQADGVFSGVFIDTLNTRTEHFGVFSRVFRVNPPSAPGPIYFSAERTDPVRSKSKQYRCLLSCVYHPQITHRTLYGWNLIQRK